MEIIVAGTGGARGWPEPGCGCASCRRAAARGSTRMPSTIVVDGQVRLGGDAERGARADGKHVVRAIPGGWARADGKHVVRAIPGGWDVTDPDGKHVVRAIPGGWDVTGPDGQRLLYPARPGAVVVPPDGTQPYDFAFVDVLGDPFQLGLLRARGLVTEATTTLAAFADHRVSSIAELQHRCAIWRVGVAADGDRVTTVRSLKMGVYRVLVMGGARSGKSERAELRMAAEPAVTYVATGPGGAGDPEWAARVAAHRARRPAWWRTVETTDLVRVLAGADGADGANGADGADGAEGAVLIDGIGTWLAAVLDQDGWDTGKLEARIAELTAAWRQANAYVVAVSDETGLGVIPETPAGRVFRDWLGRINQALAGESEETELVVAGRVVALSW